MERDYDDAANTGVYIAGAIADAKTIADLRTQLADATARAEKANDNEHVLRAERDDAENEAGVLRTRLTAATARAEMLDAELLRVRTTGHAAAHELDNIAVECGLGHSPTSGLVAAHVRALTTRAEKAEAERDAARRDTIL